MIGTADVLSGVAMQALVRVDGDEAAGLKAWLDADPVSREVKLTAESLPGTMGAELIVALVAGAAQLADLALAVAGFREDRRRQNGGTPPAVTFEVNGVEVRIEGDDPAAIERIVRRLTDGT